MTIAPETVTVPLHKLFLCPSNVRKTGVTEGIDELKANIAAIGLLHPLTIRKAARGKFAVVAGQRRLRALERLAEEGSLAVDAAVSCHLLAKGAELTEISLAENAVRLPMHPADQFEAFAALIDKGAAPAEVAARFGVSESAVKKRLKLARVSPVILRAYREEQLTLEQVEAFAVSDDAQAQESLYADLPPWQASPADIRAALTAEEITATDRRVRFVGLAAYEASGGNLRRDLFSEGEDGVFISDPALLAHLVGEKLEAHAQALRAEGWRWAEARQTFDYEARAEFSRRYPEPVPLPEEEAAELDALRAEYETLVESEDESDTVASRLTEIERRIEELEQGESVYTPETMALAGAIVTINHKGEPEIHRGLVRPEDATHGEEAASEDRERPAKPDYSAALVESLTAQKSAALGAMLAENAEVALAAVTHGLALRVFRVGGESALQLSATVSRYREPGTGRETLEQAHEAWAERIPGEAVALWGWCLAQERETLLSLLAFCAGSLVNAVQQKHDRPESARLLHAHSLGAALRLDMAQWFTPTSGNCFSRVSRPVILGALEAGKGKKPLRAWEKLKKAELASHAEKELSGSGWLPQPLQA